MSHNVLSLWARDWVELNRLCKGGNQSDLCMSNVFNLLCSPSAHTFSTPTLWTKCGTLVTGTSSNSSVVKKCRPRYLNLNAANASVTNNMQGHLKCPSASTTNRMVYRPKCEYWRPFKRQCPVSSPVDISAGFRSHSVIPQLLQQKVLQESPSLPLSTCGLPAILMFPTGPIPHYSPSNS
jgi:hypothetical protein